MNFIAYLFLACVRESFSKNASIGNCKGSDYICWSVLWNKDISLSKQLLLVIRSVIQKEIINVIPTTIKVGKIRFPRYKR